MPVINHPLREDEQREKSFAYFQTAVHTYMPTMVGALVPMLGGSVSLPGDISPEPGSGPLGPVVEGKFAGKGPRRPQQVAVGQDDTLGAPGGS